MNAITADRLTKRYGAFTAVDALSFELEPGTVTGFVGPANSPRLTPRRADLLTANGLVAAGFRALVCVVAIATSVAAGVVTRVIEDIRLGNGPVEEWAGLLAGVVAGALF